jgi:Fur family ferric uptake transcriptional regulator
MTKSLFRQFINSRNQRYTPQRDLIIEELYRIDDHVSAEEFYDVIKSKYPQVGQATVYRTLKLLVDAGLASKIEIGDGVARYEISSGREHHDHMICEKCKENIEVVDAQIENLQEKLAARYGFKLTGHKLYLYGICNKCLNK